MADKQHRYPGLKAFSDQQEPIFFGRDGDRERLLSLILLEKICVLFARSGYGKSSLLNAGIAPALKRINTKDKRRYLPLFIRFNLWGEHNKTPWFERFKAQLALQVPALDPATRDARSYFPPTLWGELKRIHTDENLVYVLIFDQFEEFFSFPPEQQFEFKHQLAELLYADIPTFVEQNEASLAKEQADYAARKIDVKAVLAIRSDRLGELHRMKDRLPAILNKRYELTALDNDQARQALEMPARLEGDFASPRFAFDPGALKSIIDHLTHNVQGESVGIEAFQLQIIAQDIEERLISGLIKRRDGDQEPIVRRTDLPQLDNIYSQYYHRKIEELPVRLQAQARLLLEDGLLFEDDHGEARRLSMDGEFLLHHYDVDQELLNRLESNFLLRRDPNTTQGYNYEISHDTLVIPIAKAKHERKYREARQKAKKQKQRLFRLIAGLALLVIGAWGFAAWAYNQKTIADEAKKKVEYLNVNLKAEIKQRQEVLFNQTYRRALNEIAQVELKMAGDDLVYLDSIASIYPEDTTMQRKVEDVRNQIKRHANQ